MNVPFDLKQARVVSPWRSPVALLAVVVVVFFAASGILENVDYQWRARAIGIARALHPVPPDENGRDFPIVLLFGRMGEDYRHATPMTGRFSEDPALTKRRLALLLAALASGREETRPRAIGVDMVLATVDRVVDPYLREALGALGGEKRVVLAATEDFDPMGVPKLVTPRVGPARLGVDIHFLPALAKGEGTVRLRVPTVVDYQREGPVPGFAAAVAELAGGPAPSELPRQLTGIPIHFWNLHYPTTERSDLADTSTLMLDLWPSEGIAPIVEAVPLWNPGEAPARWLERVQASAKEIPEGWSESLQDYVERLYADRVVLIGVGHPDDLANTPFTTAAYAKPGRQQGRPPRAPGVAVHAEAVATILQDRIPGEFPGWLRIACMVVAAAAGWCIGLRVRPLPALVVTGSALAALVAGDLVATAYANWWLPTFAVILPTALLHGAGALEQYRRMNANRERVEKWVRRLVPSSSSVVITEEEEAQFGVAIPADAEHVAWRTVIRTDLAGYTTMNRDLEKARRPDMTVRLMSEFFRRAIGAVERHGGQLTDLTGDGLVAVFDEIDPAAEAANVVAAMRDIRQVASEWRSWAMAACAAEKGLSGVRIPGIRMAAGASETSFRFVGTDQQQRTLFFGGAFILSARIEGAIKKLPVPPGVDPLFRACVHESVAQYLEPGPGIHVHLPTLVPGIDKPIVIHELILGGP